MNHQIKDCDYHDKKMGQKHVLNKGKKGTDERESKPVWNDAMRTNHQNFSNNRRNSSLKEVLTKSGEVPISTARQSSPRAAVPISIAKPVNTTAPKSLVNDAKNRSNVFQKRHSPTRRPFHQETVLKNRNLKNKVNTVKTNSVNTVKTKRVTSAVGKKGVNVVKPSACWVWRPTIKGIDHVSKDSGSYICKRFDYGDPQVTLKDTVIFDSGCSWHMTGNKSFLSNYQEYDGGFVAFAGSSKGGIETNSDAGQAEKEKVIDQEYILLPLLHTSSYGPSNSKEAVSSPHDDVAGKKIDQEPANEEDHTLKDDVDDMLHQEKMAIKHPDNARIQFEEECDAQLCKGMRTRTSSTNSFNTIRTPLNTASASRTSYPAGTSSEPQRMPIDGSFSIDINDYPDDPLMLELEDTAEIHSTGIFSSAYDDFPNTPIDDQSMGAEADFHNMEPSINVSPITTTRIHSIHPKDQIIGDLKSAVQTRRMAKKIEPKKVNQAFDDVSWVEAMQEELLQFKLLNVWTLVDLPKGKKAIGRNKKYHKGIVVRNKARLVAQDHRQEEGIDYDEVFRPVARIEAIRLFLAYASYMDFTVYQMDVKSAFLYGTIEEEVYVNQPPSFEDLEFPNKVYKVEKALYGLHQAPRAWYATLSTYLLENGFRRGTIDKTLFIKKIKNDILLVQVYVDDIIFGSTKKSLSTEFEKLMHKRFQMSSMGELTFFLGLQVEQRKDGIFLSQDKYVYDILKKFGFTTVKTASTPMETHKSLSTNAAEPDVDVHLYRSMIGTLMYLTSSMPDIMFDVCACSRFQVTPKVSHMHAVKRICRYIKGKPTLGLWYPKDSPMDLIAYSDSDYVGVSIDRKSTTGGCQFLGSRTKIHIDNESTISVIKNLVSHSKTKHIEIRFHFIRDSYEKKLIEMVMIHTDNNVADLLTKAFDVTSLVDTSVPSVLVVNHTTNSHQFTMSNRHQELASPKQTALTLASLKKTAIGKDFPNPFMAGSLSKTIKQFNDLPFSRGYTLRSGKDSLELMELMEHYTQIVCFVRKQNREIL
ncbi:putative ribonuclease H-like domain-containing protein [Tanacetum coccineum]